MYLGTDMACKFDLNGKHHKTPYGGKQSLFTVYSGERFGMTAMENPPVASVSGRMQWIPQRAVRIRFGKIYPVDLSDGHWKTSGSR